MDVGTGEPARQGPGLRPGLAIALLLAGVAALGLWRVLSTNESLPYRSDAVPPQHAHVTDGRSYSLAVPGGIAAMLAHGVPTAAGGQDGDLVNLQCRYTTSQTGSQTLSVSAESTTTKAETTVGHFTAPLTGDISVDCDGWGAMFVPDSDDRPRDWSGWAVLAATLALTAGACLALSAGYASWTSRRQQSPTAGEEDQVQRFVDVAPTVVDDHEIGGADRGDVAR